MQYGFGAAGVAAIDRRGMRRWIVILVGFALVAASVFVVAQPGQAEGDLNGETCEVECDDENGDNGEDGDPIVTLECDDGESEGESECEEFEDPFSNWTATCNGCSGMVKIYAPGENVADVEVTGDDPFTLKLTTAEGVGPKARKAKVFKDGEQMPRCTRGQNHKHWEKHWNREHHGFVWHKHMHRHDRVTTNCVIVKQKHHRIQYIVKVTDDPRFKFR